MFERALSGDKSVAKASKSKDNQYDNENNNNSNNNDDDATVHDAAATLRDIARFIFLSLFSKQL